MLEIYHTTTTALVADESTKSYVYMPIDDARAVAKGMQARLKPRDSLYSAEEMLLRVGYVRQERKE